MTLLHVVQQIPDVAAGELRDFYRRLERASARIAEAVDLMVALDVRHLPVVDRGALVGVLEHKLNAIPVIHPATRAVPGIVSYIDVFRAVQDSLEDH